MLTIRENIFPLTVSFFLLYFYMIKKIMNHFFCHIITFRKVSVFLCHVSTVHMINTLLQFIYRIVLDTGPNQFFRLSCQVAFFPSHLMMYCLGIDNASDPLFDTIANCTIRFFYRKANLCKFSSLCSNSNRHFILFKSHQIIFYLK